MQIQNLEEMFVGVAKEVLLLFLILMSLNIYGHTIDGIKDGKSHLFRLWYSPLYNSMAPRTDVYKNTIENTTGSSEEQIRTKVCD